MTSLSHGGRQLSTDRRTERLLLGVAIVALAVNLRTTVASLPPLLVEVERALGLSGAVAGLLTSLPVLCMAAFAPMAHRLAERHGREATALSAACCVAAGNGLRGLGSEPALLFAATLLAGLGVAVAGVVIPGLVKDVFGNRPGAATGAYSVAMMLGAAVAATAAVPLRGVLGSWQASLAFWAGPGLLAVGAWILLLRRRRAARAERVAAEAGPRVRLPWRSRPAWLLVGFFSAQSSMAYAVLGWLAPAYETRGWSATAAGALLGVHQLAQLGAAVLLPALSDRVHDVRRVLAAAGAATVTGVLWLVVAPDTLPWVVSVVLGLGLGGGFSLGLVLLVRRAPDAGASSRLTAMVFLVSYTVAAAAPVGVGALRDLSGGFTVPFAALLVLAVGQLAIGTRLAPAHRG